MIKFLGGVCAGLATVIALLLCIGGFSWMFESRNYENPANWFLAAIAMLLLFKAIQAEFDA